MITNIQLQARQCCLPMSSCCLRFVQDPSKSNKLFWRCKIQRSCLYGFQHCAMQSNCFMMSNWWWENHWSFDWMTGKKGQTKFRKSNFKINQFSMNHILWWWLSMSSLPLFANMGKWRAESRPRSPKPKAKGKPIARWSPSESSSSVDSGSDSSSESQSKPRSF